MNVNATAFDSEFPVQPLPFPWARMPLEARALHQTEHSRGFHGSRDLLRASSGKAVSIMATNKHKKGRKKGSSTTPRIPLEIFAFRCF